MLSKYLHSCANIVEKSASISAPIKKDEKKVFVQRVHTTIQYLYVLSIQCLAEKSLAGYYQKHPARFRPTHHWHIWKNKMNK